MLNEGIDIDIISKCTGLTKDEVNALKWVVGHIEFIRYKNLLFII